MYYLLKKPLVTEKNSRLNQLGVYVFEVEKKATKEQIRQVVEKTFRVKVVSVNTSVCRTRSRKSRMGAGRVVYWKKAMIKLAPGEKIALFEGA